jgi:hypothetical protein
MMSCVAAPNAGSSFPSAPPPDPATIRRRYGEGALRAGHPLALAVLAEAGLVIEAEDVAGGAARRAA